MDIRNTNLLPNHVYHIFNRGINGAPIFIEEKNYNYFLTKYDRYVSPYVETYAYCLLDNHFHIMVRVKPEVHLKQIISRNKERPIYWHVSNGFSSFLQGYTRGVNKVYNRSGPIFESPFKRIDVSSESYFSQLVAYIHQNPERHGLIHDFREYPYSSFQEYSSNKETILSRSEVLDWFGGSKAFNEFHVQNTLIGLKHILTLESLSKEVT